MLKTFSYLDIHLKFKADLPIYYALWSATTKPITCLTQLTIGLILRSDPKEIL